MKLPIPNRSTKRMAVLLLVLSVLCSAASFAVLYAISYHVVGMISQKIGSLSLQSTQPLLNLFFGRMPWQKMDMSGVLGIVKAMEHERLLYSGLGCLAVNLIVAAIAIPVSLSFHKRWKMLAQPSDLEIRLEKALRENELRNKYFANLSHEIRTPLNGIIGMVDALEATERDDERLSNLAMIRQSGKNLLHIVNEILDLSKLDAGKMVANFSDVNVADLVRESAATVEARCKQKGISLEVNLEDTLPRMINTDGHKLVRVLINLLGNSVKYTSEGYIKVSATRYGGGRPGDIIFTVADSGSGITRDKRDHIFESFIQGGNDRYHIENGSGLGLAISKGLVDLMDGEIWFESEEGKGSSFHFTIADRSAR